MSYYRRWLNRAFEDTKAIWIWPWITATVALPIVGSFMFTWFKGWAGWAPIEQGAVTAVGGFVVCWVIVFCVYFVSAPAKMERDSTEQYDREVRSLREENDKLRVRPYNKANEQAVRDLLKQATDSDKQLLRFLLQHGETEQGDIRAQGLDRNTTPDALLHCRQLNLIDLREDLAGAGIRARRFRIRQGFEDVLKDLLDEEPKG